MVTEGRADHPVAYFRNPQNGKPGRPMLSLLGSVSIAEVQRSLGHELTESPALRSASLLHSDLMKSVT